MIEVGIDGYSEGHPTDGGALGWRFASGMLSLFEPILTMIGMISLAGTSEGAATIRALFGPSCFPDGVAAYLFWIAWWSFLASGLIISFTKNAKRKRVC